MTKDSQEAKNQYISILSSMAKQAVFIFAGKIAFVIIGLGTSIILARILGPSSLGRYRMGLTIIQIATILSVVGLDRGLVRFLPILQANNISEARHLFLFNIRISLIISVSLALLMYIFAPLISTYYFHSDDMIIVIRMFSIHLPVLSLFKISSGAMVGLKRADVNSNISNVISPLIFLSLLFFISISSGDIFGCILSRIAADLFCILILIYLVLKKIPNTKEFTKNERVVSLNRFLSYSTPLLLIGIFYYLLGHMDIIMLGYFVPQSEVGIYSVALNIATFIIFGLSIILPIIRPHFSELSERKDFNTIEALFKMSSKWLIYSGIFMFCLILNLHKEILNIFGPEFVIGSVILILLSIGSLVNVCTGSTGQLLVMTGKEGWEIANTILIVVLNFILNWILIAKIGTIGAAIATSCSLIIINFAKLIEVYIIYKIHPYNLRFLKGILIFVFGYATSYIFRRFLISREIEGMVVLFIVVLSYVAVIFTCFWVMGLDDEEKMLYNYLRK